MSRPPITVTMAELVRKSGVPRTTVNRWVESGDIPRNADGTIPLTAGLAAIKKLIADQDERSDAHQDTQGLRQQNLLWQVENRKLSAALSRLQLEHEQGKYVLAVEVENDARYAAAHIRAGFLGMAPRLAPLVHAAAHGTGNQLARIEALIAEEVNRVLEVLNKTKFGQEDAA